MRRLLLGVSILCWSSPALAGVGFVQEGDAFTGTSTVSATLPDASTALDTLVLATTWNDADGGISCADSVGTVYQPVTPAQRGGPSISTVQVQLFHGAILDAGAAPIRVTCVAPGADVIEVAVMEYANVDLSSPIERQLTTLIEGHPIDGGTLAVDREGDLIAAWLVTMDDLSKKDPAWTTRSTVFEDLYEERVVPAGGVYGVTDYTEGAGAVVQLVVLRAAVSDAGQPDAGSDAGEVDAGEVDAGDLDAGPEEKRQLSVGCGCGDAPGAPVLLLAGLLLCARRRASAA